MSPYRGYSKWPFVKFKFTSYFHLLVYYRIYTEEDGPISLRTHFDSDSDDENDEFLGRIKVTSVPPPLSAKVVKRSIARAEKIKDFESITLYLSRLDQSPKDDDDIVDLTESGTTTEDPLSLIAKIDPPIPDGRPIPGKYLIKSRAGRFWNSGNSNSMQNVYFSRVTMEIAKKYDWYQVNEHSPNIQVFRW